MKLLNLTLAASLVAFSATADTAHDPKPETPDAMAMAVTTVGDLEIMGAFARATLPNQPAGGGFMTITNTGTEDDRLIAVTTDVSPRAEIHEMKMDGDVMRMREIPGDLVIRAGETIVLEPGGYHLMLMGLTQALVEGETLAVTLIFEKAGNVEVSLAIGARNARAHGHGG